jgi:hypothetical protein
MKRGHERRESGALTRIGTDNDGKTTITHKGNIRLELKKKASLLATVPNINLEYWFRLTHVEYYTDEKQEKFFQCQKGYTKTEKKRQIHLQRRQLGSH